ncbi:MAG: helix-turn-helix transcriptional regulator [Clostridia bacterium]|nr:helix-turn-helix transcriptional regulator [Clostridia bacterium]
MKLIIGNRIKELRRSKDITQEEFAEYLGVSYQSVSRWENGVCYPDMELLPIMSDFFGVTVDSLMGVDDAIERERVSRYLDEFQNAISVGDISACIEIARKGVAEYPNNYALLNKLMFALFVAGDDDGNIPDWEENRQKYDDEIISIGERIMKYCPDTDLRLEATARLAFQHCETGRKRKGRELYETLPTMEQCREHNIWWALEDDEKLPFLREKIRNEYNNLRSSVWLLGESGCLSDEESLAVMMKLYDLQNVILDNQSSLDTWGEARIPFVIAEIYMRLNDTDSAFAYLKKAAKAAKLFDERPEEQQQSSIILGDVTIKKTDFQTSDTRSLREITRDTWLSDDEFNPIRETKEYNEIISMLQ